MRVRMWNPVILGTLFILNVVFATSAMALIVEEPNLIRNGAPDTSDPGDRVNLRLYFSEKDESVKVSVHAVEAVGPELQDRKPVPAKPDAPAEFKNANGELRIEREVRGQPGSAAFRSEDFNFPFSRFGLGEGKYTLYYEVSVTYKKGDEVETETYRTKEVSELDIGKTARTTISVAIDKEPVFKIVDRVAYTVGEDGKLKEVKIQVSELESTGAGEVLTKKTNIPGGFKRSDSIKKEKDYVPPAATLDRRPVIHFATTRKKVSDSKDLDKRYEPTFGGKLELGSARVSVPIRHVTGKLELKTFFNSDPKDVFTMEGINSLDPKDFYGQLGESDEIVFVHGYNNDMSGALYRTAQIMYDIAWAGKGMLFSFPSQTVKVRLKSQYATDLKNAKLSVPLFKKFVSDLVMGKDTKRKAGTRVHLVAHSMGSLVTALALSELVQSDPAFQNGKKPLASVTFFAPDVELGQFATLIQDVVHHAAQKVGYYYTRSDTALWASEIENNGKDRAGRHPFFHKGMDTICADNVNSDFVKFGLAIKEGGIGHSYVGDRDRVLLDLHLALVASLDPERRNPPLTKREKLEGYGDNPHYSFLPKIR